MVCERGLHRPLWLGALLWSDELTTAIGEPISVAAVQPNVPLTEKWALRHRQRILQSVEDTLSILIGQHDLIVWPESALPGYRDQFQAEINRLSETAALQGTALITGVPTWSTGRFNSVVAIGNGYGEYRKQKVPFLVNMCRWNAGSVAS